MAVREEERVRGTQSFVRTLSECWGHPTWTLLEVAWRWVIGLPVLAACGLLVRRAWAQATGGTMDPTVLGLDKALLTDPVGALSANPMGVVAKFGGAVQAVVPLLLPTLRWLVPLVAVAWIVVSSVGRSVVLRRVQRGLPARVGTLMALQALRVAVLVVVFWLWWLVVQWAGRMAVTRPIAAHAEPNLVLYCAVVILASLGMFVGWGTVSWVLGVAPLLAMLRNLGARASLRAATRLGPVRGKLVEINLVMGIVKIALLVLALVFSACPLPFEGVTTQGFLLNWWTGVTVWYVLASDFFHVVRLASYLRLWQAFSE